MTEPVRAVDGEEPPTRGDERMAELLAGDRWREVRRDLQGESSDEAEDLLARINALDYLNTLVGELGFDLPERLGDYRITGLLGRGGMGTVFEAFQESLERVVALKVLSPQLTADPKMRKRFRTEARANATLHHQHIVPVFGFGEAQGYLYFTMERVLGVSLDRHIASARRAGRPVMEPREAARRFAGVADALAHAHRRGVLHRDVKPGNILVHPDGLLALADFGLSKMLGEHSLSVSQAGSFLGTLQYASPEQARGESVTGASDLYGLGVTLYECVTGRLPLEGSSTESALRALLHESPKPLRQVLPRAPRDLEAVLRKLLEKDPEDRYGDGEELAHDLRRVADDVPVRLRRQSWATLAWRRVRKHPALSATIAAAVLLLATTAVLWRQGRASRHENLLTAAVSHAEAEPGPLIGPGALLGPLVGLLLEVAPPSADVLELFAEAERAAPWSDRAAVLRGAYLEDPLPAATAWLQAGFGHDARRLLDDTIADAEQRSGFAGRDAVTWLRLYRLYLARAVANLTASVADAEGAARDLLKARMVRPGAAFPFLLETLVTFARGAVEVPDDDRVAVLERRLLQLEQQLPAGSRHVLGATLRAFAGLHGVPGSDLMDFNLPYAVRRRLDRLAAELFGTEASPAAAQRGPALSETLRQLGAEAVQALGDPERLDACVRRGTALLDDHVADGSPLQSWRYVYAKLQSPTAAVPTIGRREMSVELQIRGFEQLLELDPPRELLAALESEWTALVALARGGGRGVPLARVRALYAMHVAPVDQALELATAWVEAASDDPASYVCRFRVHLRRGDPQRAGFDGALAVQRAVDERLVRAELVRHLEQTAETDPEGATEWLRLRTLFAGGVRGTTR